MKKQKKGSALVLVMGFFMIFAIVIGAILVHTQQETRQTHRARLATNALEIARATANSMSSNIVYLLRQQPANQVAGQINQLNNLVHSIEPNLPPGGKFVYDGAETDSNRLTYILDRGKNDFSYEEILDPSDEWYGYSIARLDYEVVSFMNEDTEVANLVGFDGMGVRQRVTIDYIPLYQFAIFYDGTLELHPGPQMDVRGRVHSNDDMHLTASSGLKFHERVTCAKRILRYVQAGQTGKVEFKVPNDPLNPNGAFTWKDMRNPPAPHNGDDYLDHLDESWYQGALDRWKQRVLDQAHNISPIKPPLPAGSEMYDLFKRADSTNDTPQQKGTKFEYLADLIITGDPGNPSTINMWRQTIDSNYNRTLTKVTPPSLVQQIVKAGEFYDGHQQTVVRTLDIDVGALNAAGSAVLDWAASKGVIYVSTTPGETDVYSLAAANRDPVVQKNADGSIKFNTTTRAPLVQSGQGGWLTSGGQSGYLPAVRVFNAKNLPTSANNSFALYTDRPIYTAGDINNPANPADRATAVIAGEAVTVTSTRQWLATEERGTTGPNSTAPNGKLDSATTYWGKVTALDTAPAGYTKSVGYTRDSGTSWNVNKFWDEGKWWNKPAQTTVTTNVIFVMGNTAEIYNNSDPTGGTTVLGSGGAHNVMRYLEHWSGHTHRFEGSMIVLFEGPVSLHKYRCCDQKGYYQPPTRDYRWDNRLQNSVPPPGMPVLMEIERDEFQRADLDYVKLWKP